MESVGEGDFRGWWRLKKRKRASISDLMQRTRWTARDTHVSFLTCICRVEGFFPPPQSEHINLITADDVLMKCHLQCLQNILHKGTVIVGAWKPIFFIFCDILALSSSFICAFICSACYVLSFKLNSLGTNGLTSCKWLKLSLASLAMHLLNWALTQLHFFRCQSNAGV